MNIGLVLSGGMAKGAYQIGALKAINEWIPQEDFKYISCASVGVLNGYAYATGVLDRAEQMWKDLCTDNARLLIGQVLRSSLLQSNIAKLYDKDKALSSAFYVSLLDIKQRSLVYKDLHTVEEDSIPLYLKASVAMPIYNRAVQIANISYFDGAMVDNIPVFPLQKHRFDFIICIYFDDTCLKFENTYFDNKVVKITFPCESMLKQSLVFKQETVNSMIEEGYEKTHRMLKYVFCNGYKDLEHIYHAIEFLNQGKNNSLRITGDVLVSNLNKITQKLTKRKIM